MAKRGRKPKTVVPTLTDVQKAEQALAAISSFKKPNELEKTYRVLAEVRSLLNDAIYRVGAIDEAETVAEAAFKSGRTYGVLEQAMDKITTTLENLQDKYNFDDYEDLFDN